MFESILLICGMLRIGGGLAGKHFCPRDTEVSATLIANANAALYSGIVMSAIGIVIFLLR